MYILYDVWNYMYTIQVQSALFKIKQLLENVLRWPKAKHMPIFSQLIIVIEIKIRTITLIALLIYFRRSYFVYPAYL